MNAEKMKGESSVQRALQSKTNPNALQMEDNRHLTALQSGLTESIQRVEDEEDELLQGKFETTQLATDEEDEMLQGKFDTVQQKNNQTGMPTDVKTDMEESFSADFSGVRVHPDSSKAPEVGALAYTQGTDIHFAPGQFKPDTVAGRQLLGHELSHVVQQAEGRVQPTTEINGMPVNDDISLENEADKLGHQAAAR